MYFNSFSAGIVFRRQILTSKDDPHAERVKVELQRRESNWSTLPHPLSARAVKFNSQYNMNCNALGADDFTQGRTNYL